MNLRIGFACVITTQFKGDPSSAALRSLEELQRLEEAHGFDGSPHFSSTATSWRSDYQAER